MILKTADDRRDDLRRLEDMLAGSRGERQSRIAQEIREIRFGVGGERAAIGTVNRSYRDDGRTAVLHDLRIKDASGEHTHIDHVVIQRVRGVVWTIESHSGVLRCNEHGDWSIRHGAEFKPVPSPQERARRNAVALQNWFRRQCIASIRRVVPIVLLSSDSTVFREQRPSDVEIVKADRMALWSDRQSEAAGFGSIPSMLLHLGMARMGEGDLRILGHRLLRAHEPAGIDAVVRDEFVLDMDDVIAAPPRNPRPAEAPSAAPSTPDPQVREVATSHGVIRLHSQPDGSYAIRHRDDEELEDAVRWACHGRAGWDATAKNWVVAPDALSEVLHHIG